MSQLKYLNLLSNQSDIENIFKSGVYKMYHKESPELFYIGSTFASGHKRNLCGVYRRMLAHIGNLNNNKHSSKLLQGIVNVNGIAGLRFEIIELCENSLCRKREQYYLDTLLPQLNSSKSAVGCTGVKHTDETKNRKRELQKGRGLEQSVYDKMKRTVYQLDKAGLLVNTYSSTKEAAKCTNIDRASINNAALGKRLSAGGYMWTYEAIEMGLAIQRL